MFILKHLTCAAGFGLLLLATQLEALENGLARTPPMGWNSWNKFGCNVNEQVIKETADAMVANGMKDAGYTYVNIDDCWQVDRDANGNIVVDAKNFPGGIKPVADYVHFKGLKLGIYSDAGKMTCAKRPGSHAYEYQDARQYAAWGVDYLKYDWCSADGQNAQNSYETMRDALAKTGRPIVFSICEWGSNKPWLWAGNVGNLWRTTSDIQDCWDCKKSWGGMGWTLILDASAGLESYNGPGHWNDPDMLEVGNANLTGTESRAHFSMWAMLAAPLIAGNDLRNMPGEIHDILTNAEVIAVDQDALGKQAVKVRDDGDFEVWVKPLSDGSRAVALLNRSTEEKEMTASWMEVGYPARVSAEVRDLWAKKGVGVHKDHYSAKVASHGVVMVKVTPQ